jgi:type 1 glutamine amidotransferase
VSKRALVVWGGWEGHQPRQVGELFRKVLVEDGFEVEISDTLDAFNDGEKLKALNVIVPVWTMGKISRDQSKAVSEACTWQFMTGGQFVGHPGNDGTRYRVKITDKSSPLTQGIEDFDVSSEQYYMHVDPANKVLATTSFPIADGPHVPNGPVEMPVIWTRLWGKGKVYYNSLGHSEAIVAMEPVLTLMRRGFAWAAK